MIQYAEARLSDYGLLDRVKIFFIQARLKESNDGIHYRYYKIYKARKVLIREVTLTDGY